MPSATTEQLEQMVVRLNRQVGELERDIEAIRASSLAYDTGRIRAGDRQLSITKDGIVIIDGTETTKSIRWKEASFSGSTAAIIFGDVQSSSNYLLRVQAGIFNGITGQDVGELELQATAGDSSAGTDAQKSELDLIADVTAGQTAVDLKYTDGATVASLIKYDKDEELVFNENSLDIDFRVEGATIIDVFNVDAGLDQVLVGTSIAIKERADQQADIAGYGQLWVKNTTPCQLWFTDDAGTDTQLA